ncbi:hypothetical protein GOBAR_DD34055 [Gossypium barbadense]|nr:hypothetical protein GOBAR_DD34055 [Gossypium barbadense]
MDEPSLVARRRIDRKSLCTVPNPTGYRSVPLVAEERRKREQAQPLYTGRLPEIRTYLTSAERGRVSALTGNRSRRSIHLTTVPALIGRLKTCWIEELGYVQEGLIIVRLPKG